MMGAFKIEVTAEDINRAVADALLKSALGAAIEAAVTKACSTEESRTWPHTAVDKAVDEFVKQQVQVFLETHWAEAIRQKLREALEQPSVIEKAVAAHVKLISERLTRW